MKTCPNCHTQLDDLAAYCTTCGMPFTAPQQPIYAVADPYDHTAEFDPQDVANNKLFAMLPYLFGAFGMIITLLAAKESKYAMFHLRQGLKILIAEILVVLIASVTAWLFLPILAAAVCVIILTVLQIIGFVQVCTGKAKEPAIVRSLGFLK